MTLPAGYLLIGPDGVYGGPFTDQGRAIGAREELIAAGSECWLEPVHYDKSMVAITDRDPGDENDYECRAGDRCRGCHDRGVS